MYMINVYDSTSFNLQNKFVFFAPSVHDCADYILPPSLTHRPRAKIKINSASRQNKSNEHRVVKMLDYQL